MSDPTGPQTFDLTGDDDEPYADATADELDAAERDIKAPATPLDELVAELTVDIGAELTRLDVEGRPGWVAVYRRDITGREVERYRKAATKRGATDVVKFAGLVIDRLLSHIERNGTTVEDPDLGGPLTFRSPFMQQSYGAPSAIEAARKFFGTDGYLNAQANAALEAAGWGEDAVEADPT
jgi:hypothetical protein